jgi:hypothetical protein
MASMIDGATVHTLEHGAGLWQCDRDFKIKTATEGAASFEDLKANPTTFAKENWDELSLVGVYKKDGNGVYVSCPTGELATEACLSVWDYVPTDNNSNPLNIEVRGGHLLVDAGVAGDIWEHQLYTILAPNIPSASGGVVRFFDGYYGHFAGGKMDAVNPSAGPLNAGDNIEQGRLRILLYYPKGQTVLTHVLRLITYRPLGSFK